jgi:hypothetical protein
LFKLRLKAEEKITEIEGLFENIGNNLYRKRLRGGKKQKTYKKKRTYKKRKTRKIKSRK